MRSFIAALMCYFMWRIHPGPLRQRRGRKSQISHCVRMGLLSFCGAKRTLTPHLSWSKARRGKYCTFFVTKAKASNKRSFSSTTLNNRCQTCVPWVFFCAAGSFEQHRACVLLSMVVFMLTTGLGVTGYHWCAWRRVFGRSGEGGLGWGVRQEKHKKANFQPCLPGRSRMLFVCGRGHSSVAVWKQQHETEPPVSLSVWKRSLIFLGFAICPSPSGLNWMTTL